MEKIEFLVSKEAKQKLNSLCKQYEGKEVFFRILIEGGGCSGFQYKYSFESGDPQSDDIVIKDSQCNVVIDKTSYNFVKGSVLNYIDQLGRSKFEITNPNSTAKCGCGNSFSINLF